MNKGKYTQDNDAVGYLLMRFSNAENIPCVKYKVLITSSLSHEELHHQAIYFMFYLTWNETKNVFYLKVYDNDGLPLSFLIRACDISNSIY